MEGDLAGRFEAQRHLKIVRLDSEVFWIPRRRCGHVL